MTLSEVISRLEEYGEDETIYAEAPAAGARAVVAPEPDDGSLPPAADGMTYLLEVSTAREAIEVWSAWRPGQTPTADDKLAAVTYYAENDAWLPPG